MARMEYTRRDVVAFIQEVAGKPQWVRISAGPWSTEIPLGPVARGELPFAPWPPAQAGAGGQTIHRLALDIRTSALHAHPWEDWLAAWLDVNIIVRTSRVLPRVKQASFTTPLRILHCDARHPGAALMAVRGLFGSQQRNDQVTAAYVGSARSLASLAGREAPPDGWPVVDVLHLHAFPTADADLQFSPSAHDFGSLGWLSRRVHAWQTRLLVIDAAGPIEAAGARRFAAALVARGGPAVVIRDAHQPLELLYDRLIHDQPIDLFAEPRNVPVARLYGVFVGEGREELARVSAPVLALADMLPHHADWHFTHSEQGGFVPLARELEGLRGTLHAQFDASRLEVRSAKPRHVNASLKHGAEDARAVDPATERLRLDRAYRLAIQIGPKQQWIPVYGSSAFQEIARAQGQKGAWLEVAVSGVGFEIAGDAVQDLWLPFDEPSDEVWFTVTPTAPGVAVLRYTLYHDSNVVQTFRLAALTTGDESYPDPAPDMHLLAGALEVPEDELVRATYASRLEYEAAPIAAASEVPARHVSLVVNHVAGRRVITVKGDRYFFDVQAGMIDDTVRAARAVLDEAAVNRTQQWTARFGIDEAINSANIREFLPRIALAGWRMYARVFARDDRKQLEQDLEERKEARITVAHSLLDDAIPWTMVYDRPLFDATGNGSNLQLCTAALPDASGQLAVRQCNASQACLLRHQVAPDQVACPLHFWGFRHEIEVPARQSRAARRAARPASTGTDPANPQAAVAPAASRQGSAPSPRRAAAAASRSGQAMAALVVEPPRLAAVLNSTLESTKDHQEQLRKLTAGAGPAQWTPLELQGRVIDALRDPELDLVYLFCHACEASNAGATEAPLLVFGEGSQSCVTPDQLDAEWRNKPLVVINGCSTAAHAAGKLSPFVLALSRDCKAGSVIGTEVPVHEVLASQVALGLFKRVLQGESVGAALLALRRELLARSNPMGLAYALFGPAEHRIRTKNGRVH